MTISKSDLDDVRVICLMSFISGTPRLCDQNLDDKIKEASLTVQERDAVRAARHGRLRKEAEDHSGSLSSLFQYRITYEMNLDLTIRACETLGEFRVYSQYRIEPGKSCDRVVRV